MIRSTRLLGSVALVASFALGVTACGDGEATIYGLGGDAGVNNGGSCITGQTRNVVCRNDCLTGQVPEQTCINNAWNQDSCRCTGTAVESCAPGSNRAAALCAGTVCGANQTPAQICNSTGVGYACGCVTTSAVTHCTVGATDTQFCSTACAVGQTSTRTCGGDGTWGNCGACTGTGPVDTGNSCTVTEQRLCTGPAPANCNGAGQYYREVCGSNNTWSGTCQCFGTATGTTCTAGNLGTPTSACPACPSGTTARQACNAAGTGFTGACYCVGDGSSICPAGEMVANNCGVSCTGTAYAALQCNSSGTGFISGSCRCTGATTINRTGFIAVDQRWQYNNLRDSSEGMFCRLENVSIRIFDGVGAQVPISSPSRSRTYSIATTDTGSTMFEVTCGSGPMDPVHPALTATGLVLGHRFSEYGVTTASVTGGDSTSLLDQTSVGLFCRVSNSGVPNYRVQGALAVNGALVGRCPNF